MIRLTENEVKTWLPVLLAVCALFMFAMGVGVWKAGVDVAPQIAAKADKTARSAIEATDSLKASLDAVRASQEAMTDRMEDVSGTIKKLIPAVDQLNRTVKTNIATKTWVIGLKDKADVEHEVLKADYEKLSEKNEDLEKRLRKAEEQLGKKRR